MVLTSTQYRVLATLQIMSGSLSAWGSSVVIGYNYKCFWKSVGQRLLLVVSMADAMFSLQVTAQPFLVNKDTVIDTALWAVGNDTSCRFVGALSILVPSWRTEKIITQSISKIP